MQKLLTRRIGEIAQKLQLERDPAIHTARALRLYQKEAIQALYGCLDQLIAALQSLGSAAKGNAAGSGPNDVSCIGGQPDTGQGSFCGL